MNKNRILALALTGALALSLTACGGKTDAVPPEDTAPVVETAPAVEDVASPAPETTTAPEATPEATPEESAKPDSNAPAPAPSGELSVQDIWNTVSSGLELPKLMDLDDDLLEALYGINAGDLDSYVAKIPMMNVHATEFFIAKVRSGKLDAVKAACQSRQADLEAQWEQYLPEQLELVKNYKLISNGDYLMFAVTEYADQAETAFNGCTK